MEAGIKLKFVQHFPSDRHPEKRKSPDNSIIIILFFIHSVTKSSLQCASNTSSSFTFLQVVLVDGIPLSSCTVYRYLCSIFLDDISSREQFAFLIYCYRVKFFPTIYALCFTGVCVAKKIAPIFKYPLNWGWCAWSAEGSLTQWLPNGKLLLLSLTKCHGVPCSLPSRITTKVLKNCKTFSSRPRPRLSFLSSRRLETKTLVSRTTSLRIMYNVYALPCQCMYEPLFLTLSWKEIICSDSQ